jgi:hypothetical protein
VRRHARTFGVIAPGEEGIVVPPIVDNEARSRLEATLDGQRAELVYRREGDRLVLVHTGVPDELEGRGIGGELVRAAIDLAAELGLTVVPECPFASRWLRRHPEEARRVTIERPTR